MGASTVLLTGATGTVGLAVSEALLARGHDVIGYALEPPPPIAAAATCSIVTASKPRSSKRSSARSWIVRIALRRHCSRSPAMPTSYPPLRQ